MKYLAGLMVAFLIVAPMAWAQESTDPVIEVGDEPTAPVLTDAFEDQAEWESVASRTEAALEAGRASSTVLSTLRSDLADWRDIFLDRQGVNSARIATVRAQIASLGAAADGEDVDPRVSARRDVLNAQLIELRAPVTLATEAYTQANGLIGEIDSLLRGRQAARFTERFQSPLNPAGWGGTWDDLSVAVRATRAEISGQIENPSRRAELVGYLPAIFVLLAVAAVFVLRGRSWFSRLVRFIDARTIHGRGVARFVVSLGQVLVPFMGLAALTVALLLTGMMGRRAEAVLENVALFGLFPILAHWLAGHLLPKSEMPDDHPLGLPLSASSRAHRRFVTLGYALMLFCLLDSFLTVNTFGAVSYAVMMFIAGVLVAWPLFRFGRVIGVTTGDADGDTSGLFRNTLRSLLSRGAMIAAVGGTILAALGYSSAFEVLTFPVAVTIYVLGILVLLQALTMDTYTLFSKSENGAQTALIPVLIAFLLVVLAVPILAIVWGAQITDLTELWTRFQEGFALGETRISPTSFLLFAVVFVVGYTVTRLVQSALRTTVLPRTTLDAGGQNAIVSGMGYVGIFLAAVIAITTAGIDLSGLAIVAGALSVGIGFGLQNIVSNFVAGIILLIERPISQGDWIEVGGQMGYVRDISVRSTRIETFDRTDVIVPNADLVSNQVTNWTRGNNVGRVIVPVGVAYGTDTEWVTSILKEIAEAHPMVLLNPGPAVVFQGFGADSLDFEIRAILRDVNYVLSVKSDMNHAIAKRFVAEGIEIPFAQRDLWLRNPETLTRGPQAAPETPVSAPQVNTPSQQKDNDG